MMEMAGEIADGAVLNYCVPPEYNLEAHGAIGEGRGQSRAQSGRHRPARN